MKNIIKALLPCIAAMSIAHSASAISDTPISLSLTPVLQTIDLGQPVTFSMVLSGLGGTEDLNSYVNSFNIAIDFDSTALQYTGYTFNSLFGDGVNTSINNDYSAYVGPGVVDLACSSSVATALAEGSSFALGTITFNTLANGPTSLVWDESLTSFSDGSGNTNLDINGNTTGATVAAVPEPSTYASIVLGALGLLCWGSKSRRKISLN